MRAGTFDLLVYTDAASAVPSEWCAQVCSAALSLASVTRHSPHTHREESEARLVVGAEAVRLRGFSTRVHRIDALVAYKADDGGAA